MADLFWYEVSVTEPELYMEAQAKYLKAVADYLSPEQATLALPEKKEIEESASERTARLYLPEPRKASAEEQHVRGMKKDFLVVVNELSGKDFKPVRTHKKSASTSKSKLTAPRTSPFRKSAPRAFQAKPKKKPSPPQLLPSPGRDKPVFNKLINDGSKPPGDVVSVASSDDSIDIETLFSHSSVVEPWGRKTPVSEEFRTRCAKSIRKCPFCDLVEDIETETLTGLSASTRREVKAGGWKDYLSDGSILSCLPNGDLKHSFPSGQIVYLFRKERVLQALYPHGHAVSVFPSGQVEMQCPKGSKFVSFPDHTAAFVNPDGSLEAPDFLLSA